MPRAKRPALRPGAAKSKEQAEGEQPYAGPRETAGSPAGASEAASQHQACIDPRESVAQVGAAECLSLKTGPLLAGCLRIAPATTGQRVHSHAHGGSASIHSEAWPLKKSAVRYRGKGRKIRIVFCWHHKRKTA